MKTYRYESFMNHKDFYEVHDEGLHYRPHKGRELFVKWENIGRLDGFGDKVIVYDSEYAGLFHIPYVTSDFTELIERICAKLAEVNAHRLHTREFMRNLLLSTFFYVVSAGLAALSIFLIKTFYPPALYIWLFVACSWVFLALLPKKIVVEESRILLMTTLTRRGVPLTEIRAVTLEKVQHQNGTVLYIFIELKDGKKIKLHFFSNILLLFITLRALLNTEAPPAATGQQTVD